LGGAVDLVVTGGYGRFFLSRGTGGFGRPLAPLELVGGINPEAL
jgi:hypothetical protein